MSLEYYIVCSRTRLGDADPFSASGLVGWTFGGKAPFGGMPFRGTLGNELHDARGRVESELNTILGIYEI